MRPATPTRRVMQASVPVASGPVLAAADIANEPFLEDPVEHAARDRRTARRLAIPMGLAILLHLLGPPGCPTRRQSPCHRQSRRHPRRRPGEGQRWRWVDFPRANGTWSAILISTRSRRRSWRAITTRIPSATTG